MERIRNKIKLSNEPYGSVFKCRTCHAYELSYKNIYVQVNGDYFLRIHKLIDSVYQQHLLKDNNKNERNIRLCLQDNHLCFQFSLPELEQLRFLLANALSVEKLLNQQTLSYNLN